MIRNTQPLFAATAALALAAAASAAPITPGDLVVYQVGNTGSTTALSSAAAAVNLVEYTPGGTLVQTIAAPTADSGTTHTVTASGTATSEGQITLSPNGSFVAFTGYDATAGTASVVGTTSASTARVVGLLNVGTGALDTSTALSDVSSANNIRGAVTNDGTAVYTSGTATGTSSGVHYATVGATTSTQIVGGNQRVVNIFNGKLFVSSGSATTPATLGVSSFGGLPTAATTPTNTGIDSATGANPYAFNFLNLGGTDADTAYVADNAGNILKYSLVGGSYTQTGSAALAGVLGLSAVSSGSTVMLYATTTTGIYSLTDASGYNGALTGTPTSIVTAGANTAFRGIVATAATPEPASLGLLAASGLLLARRRR